MIKTKTGNLLEEEDWMLYPYSPLYYHNEKICDNIFKYNNVIIKPTIQNCKLALRDKSDLTLSEVLIVVGMDDKIKLKTEVKYDNENIFDYLLRAVFCNSCKIYGVRAHNFLRRHRIDIDGFIEDGIAIKLNKN